MEASVKKVEAMFQKADSDLDCIANKIERHSRFMNSSIEPVNILKVLKAVQELKKDYKEVVDEIAALKETQKNVMEDMQDEMKTVCGKLRILQDKCGIDE
ncbi:Uncharacterised protein g7641 [Pycnogonum litorale]